MERIQFSKAVEQVLEGLPGIYETTAIPVLILMTGLPGTGKSYLARKLSERLPAVIVESDYVRKSLFPRPTYTPEESTWVHRVAHAAIERLLKAGYRVIYDATNLIEWQREKAYQVAHGTGARLVIVQVQAPEETVRARLATRQHSRDRDDLSDASWEIYVHLRRRVDPIRRPHLVVNTQDDVDDVIRKIARAVRNA